jgi:hypothetical protein
MASRIAEAVRNSPLVGRKGGYSPMLSHDNDPFVQGIAFHAQHLATVEVPDRVGTDSVHIVINKELDSVQKYKKSPPKVTLTIKATSIAVKNSQTRVEVVYPIYLISYCGNAKDADIIFFFIYKNKEDQKTRAEIFKCSSEEKVIAITRTISKAFHIAYKAWQTKKRQQQRQYSPKSSPLLTQKMAKDKEMQNLGKTAIEKAAGGAITTAYYTPPIPKKVDEERQRSGSLDGDDDINSQRKIISLEKVKVKNVASGSTHDVTVTDDFDEGFNELVTNRHGQSLSIVDNIQESFKFDDIKCHTAKEDVDEPLIQF